MRTSSPPRLTRARLGEPEPSLASLGTAVEKGWFDFRHMEHDPDLESLRGDPRFAALLSVS